MDGKKDLAAGERNAADAEKKGGVNVIDTTVDRMFEAAVAEEWERQNRTGREICPEWDEAIKKVETTNAAELEKITGAMNVPGLF